MEKLINDIKSATTNFEINQILDIIDNENDIDLYYHSGDIIGDEMYYNYIWKNDQATLAKFIFIFNKSDECKKVIY
jgi:hypothetical protein